MAWNGQYSRVTRYEVAAFHPDGREYLVGYINGLSRHSLLTVMRNHADAVIANLGIGDSDVMTFGTKPRAFATCSGWTIRFTGRTERECKVTADERQSIAL
jgi:hypothetical protein